MTSRLLALFIAAATALALSAFEAKADGVDLSIEVSGLHNYKGQVVLAIWPASAERAKFPDPTKVQLRDERPGDPPCDLVQFSICVRTVGSLQNLAVPYVFKALPLGDYAVFVFHDENNNGILDTGILKRPLEARGYSQVVPEDVGSVRSTITFQQARFTLNGNKAMSIGLRYPPRP
jgi:uncharacterized protein (DUF2141 family)